MIRPVFLILLIGFLASCGKKEKPVEETPQRLIKVPIFNADSAFWFTEKQVKFGPRIPNSPAHKTTGDYLTTTLKNYGASVITQEFESNSFDGKKLFLRNIIASFYPEKQKRILLAAHWDTRPFSDKDKDKPDAKFDGANDGASGVAVLLEVARTLSQNSAPDTGIDIILFDGEDWGEKENASGRIQPPQGLNSWWCLGSQYWGKHKHKPNYTAYYGILLDMVGAQGTHFFQEGYSMEYAPKIVDKVWNTAARLGHGSLFVRQKNGSITDDHVYVNELAKIPMIDIIPYDPSSGSFGDYHHTQKDNMSVISKETLGAVGNVLMNVIYYEGQ
ncbi:MAG: M28 family peptidase [Cyclobacteriaceae bacterium]|nr:M28 family peptidase [Cyclobacteriaceae bacterium]